MKAVDLNAIVRITRSGDILVGMQNQIIKF